MARSSSKKQRRGFRIRFHGASFIQLFITVVLAGGFFVTGVMLLWFATLDIPSVSGFHNRQVAESTKIYDRTGDILLYDVHGSIRRTLVPLNEISRHAKNAVIAIEDAEFYEHRGVRPLRTLKAVWDNIMSGDLLGGQGGSTITQQVVKLTLLTPEKTITRKVKEWVLAFKLEQELTKDEILEIYLNEAPYGGTLYGIEEASQVFFSKSATELNLAESAYLAALPQAPTYYSPHGNHRDALEARKNLVLSQMLENRFITQEEYEEARVAEVEFSDIQNSGIKAPHFVFYVLEYLEEEYGAEAVQSGGLHVISTLDYELQEPAEEIVREYALSNASRFNAENAALVAIDPATGQILTMVGSRGYFDEDIDGKFNAALGLRQPGSSFKPFVYATGFTQGYTPETILFNLRTQFSTACSPIDITNSSDPCYSPRNYDGEYTGPITIRNALAQSVNIPAVKMLYLVGINNALATAERVGISTLTNAARYGLTLVLGGGEVTLLDMVSSYGVFAQEGVRHPHTPILRVEDGEGEILEEYKEQSEQVLDPQITRQISDILSDNVARTPLYGANSPLYFGEGVDVAAKTGTTNDNRDAWIIGYTPTIAVGTWAGNNIPEPMNQISGLIVTPMWRAFMDVAIEKYPGGNFVAPEPAPENIHPVLRGIWNVIPGEPPHSILYWVQKTNPRGGRPANPGADPQFPRWEYPIQLWANAQATPNDPNGNGTPGSTPSDQFSITSPQAGSSLPVGSSLTIIVNAPDPTITQVSYYLNGTLIGTSDQRPFDLTYLLSDAGVHTLRAAAAGPSGTYTNEITITVE